MNTEHDKMATMDVDAVVIDPDAQCPEHGCARATCDDAHHIDDVDTSAPADVSTPASDGVPEVDPHRAPTGPTAAELLTAPAPAFPPGWNPAHSMGMMHPQDIQREQEVRDMQRRQGIPVLPGLPPMPVPPVPFVAPVPTTIDPSLAAQQSRYVSHETACEAVRREVTLPTMSAAYEHTDELRRLLVVGQSVAEIWASLGVGVLGDVTHAAPGLHACVINTTSFATQALEALDRAVARPADWVEAFERIVAAASRHHAWRLLGLASGALMAGPFTPLWRNAVDWCLAYWDDRG